MERSADWIDQARGDWEHAQYPNAHPSGSPRTRYTWGEAERLVHYAADLLCFCEDPLATL